METKTYSWLDPRPEEPKARCEEIVVVSWPQRLARALDEQKWILALLSVFLLLGVWSRGDERKGNSPSPAAAVDVVVPLIAIARDQAVRSELLRQLPVLKRDLTKTQLYNLVRPEDFSKFNGTIRAKKNLPPGRPLAWSDLKWTHSTAASTQPLVIYAKE